ncbi:MAG TPA: hypothetical protein VKK79_06115 [Candidatus Lokiarchaeia archaeon]|nr:hypothetical protein [Candidatus Lokiarchaeia archaeon]
MTDIYVATGIADITPDHPVYLAGYSARKKKSRGVTSQIKVQALKIEQSSLGKVLLILTYDLLEFGKPEIQTIKDAISKEFQLNPEDVFIAASHTHYAPNITHMFWVRDNPGYLEFVTTQTIATIRQCWGTRVPVTLWYGLGETVLGVNRRRLNSVKNRMEIGSNPTGVTDPKVQVLGFRHATENKWVVVLFRLSCHPVTVPPKDNTIHGDWPLEAVNCLNTLHKGQIAFLFLQGTAGNLNPRRFASHAEREHVTFPDVLREGEQVANIINEILSSKNDQISDEQLSLRTILSSLPLRKQQPASKTELERMCRKLKNRYKRMWAKIQLEKMASSGKPLPQTVQLTVHVIQITPEMRIIGLGGEVLVEVGKLINDVITGENILVAYANDVLSYIPSSQIVKEDMQYHRYEGEQSIIYYNLPARYSEEIDTEIKEIKKIIEEFD